MAGAGGEEDGKVNEDDLCKIVRLANISRAR
jgi:hypothetical protein